MNTHSKDNTVYIVSGYMRSGTSMMMRALEAGGMQAAYSLSRNKFNETYGDKYYLPNAGGYYELEKTEYVKYGFPRGYEGKLIKLLGRGIWTLVPGNYKVVFMLRDYEEIRQSYDAFFGKQIQISESHYEELMQDTINMMEIRNDIEYLIMQYRWVVDNPFEAFNKLKEYGWSIDVDRAIQVVDPAQYRFRLEELEIGI